MKKLATQKLRGPALIAGALLVNLLPAPQAAYGQGRPMPVIQGAAEREIARRQDLAEQGDKMIAAGKEAMRDKEYETAVSQFRGAVDLIPDSETTKKQRQQAVDGFCKAAVALAEQRIAEGRYQDAENLCKLVVEDYQIPDHAAVKLMVRLEDPDYFNKTVTPRFVANIEEVKKLLVDADGYFNSGRFDMAFRRYEQVLNIDPYNIAARKGQQKVNQARDNYANEAYNETRSRAIWQLDKAWENPVRRFGPRDTGVIEQAQQDVRGTAAIEAKLNRIIIPKIELREATIREAIDFLKQKSRDLDTAEADPAKRGVNIVLKLDSGGGGYSTPAPAAAAPSIPGLEAAPTDAAAAPAAAPAAAAGPPAAGESRITLTLNNVPLMEVLRYITNLANLKIKIDPYAVSVVPISEPTDVLITKEYKVPPNFISTSQAPAAGASSSLSRTTTPTDTTRGGQSIAGRMGAREFLEAQGVQFAPGATANYLASSSRLVVRNTQENLDLIDTLVDAAIGAAPTQVEIESKFVEITQTNLKELGVDWLLGQFNIPGSSRVFGSGGTSGTAPAMDTADYPFVAPGATAPVGVFPLTAGNRSGRVALSASAIDSLLLGAGATGSSLLAPGVFGISGVFTDPQFQVVIRALDQKKGVDLLSAPRVTTKSGQRAVIEIIREFIYPTEFDPPEVPTDLGGGGDGGGATAIVVTPTTPTTFTTRNTGVTLEVEPVVGPDGYTIDLNLVPQVVEFEGFINYGSPIFGALPSISLLPGGFGLSLGTSVLLTENVINQPVFSTRKVTTSVSIWDGQTVVLGGLMREDVQKVQDKVPLLGDIPLLGRLFRSDVDQHQKRNLVIFVTARLINPAGEPVQLDEEKEEVVDPLPLPDGAAPAEMPIFTK